MSSPAAWLAVVVVAGVVIGVLVPVPVGMVAVGAAGSWAVASIALRRASAGGLLVSVLTGALLASVVLGANAQERALRPSLRQWIDLHADADVVRLTGALREDAAPAAYGIGATLDVTRVRWRDTEIEASGGVRLTIAGTLARTRVPGWTAGRRIECDVRLREPLDYRDVGVGSDRDRLARSGIVLLGSVKSAALVTERGRASPLAEAAAATRRLVRRAIADAVGRWSPQSAGIVTAILIGDRSGLRPDDERRLQEAGTYHVIAISGGNIALLTVTLLFLARWCGVPPRRAAAFSIALLAFYGYMAGLAPSVLRATLVGVVVLAARSIDHRGTALNALGVAAAAAAVAAPLSVLDPGFILSFGATVGIVLFAGRVRLPLSGRRGAPRLQRTAIGMVHAAAMLFGATVSAELALAPVGARLFGRITAAGLALNFIAIPVMSCVQVAGMTTVALYPVSAAAARGTGWVAHVATRLLVDSARLVDLAPWLVRDVPPPGTLVILSWYAGWIVAACSKGLRRALGLTFAGAATLAILWTPPALRAVRIPAPPPNWSRIVFFDVGQGDATLLWPAGADPVLVDAGGVPGSSFDLGRRVTLPASWALGVRRLSRLVLTHGDPDHVGGALPVLRALRPQEVWEGIPVPGHAAMDAIRDAAARRGIPWRLVRSGDAARVGAAIVSVVHPPAPDWERRKVRNDDSVVLDVRIRGISIVLPGDITAAVEPQVLERLQPALFRIVKAPHHGSAGSSSPAFVAALHPAAVVFSAGRRNPFGHPSPAVVRRYRAAGARVLRTDADGEVIVDTDGRDVVVWTYTGKREWLRVTTPVARQR